MVHFVVIILLAIYGVSSTPVKDDRRGRFQDTIIVDGDLSAAHGGIANLQYLLLHQGSTTTTSTTTTTNGATCRYWCRTNTGAAYCCEENTGTTTATAVKDGNCPAVRDECPPVRYDSAPPNTCSNDGSCPGVDKCCFDICLKEHICKKPE